MTLIKTISFALINLMSMVVDKIFECKVKISAGDLQALQVVTEKMTIVMVGVITEGMMIEVHYLHHVIAMTTGIHVMIIEVTTGVIIEEIAGATTEVISGATTEVISGAITEIGMDQVDTGVILTTNLPGIDVK